MNEKKFFFLRHFLCIFLFGSFSIVTQAQRNGDCDLRMDIGSVLKVCTEAFSGPGAPDIPSSLCKKSTVAPILNPSCSEGYVPLAVFCVDLAEVSTFDEEVQWPAERHPVFLRYEYDTDQFLVSPQILTWRYITDVISQQSGECYQVFQGEMPVNSVLLDNNNCNNITAEGIYEFEMEVEVVTENTRGIEVTYETYPIGDYGLQGDIFSCDIFLETKKLCDDPSVEPIAPIVDLTICLDCATCDLGSEGGPPPEFRKIATVSVSENPVAISPNPFTHQIQYRYIAPVETPISVRLFTASGVEVFQSIERASIGENNYWLDTEHLPGGLYYLELNNGVESHINRLIKID